MGTVCVCVPVGLQKRTVLQHKTPIHQVVEDYILMAAIHKLLQVQGILPLNRGNERRPEQRFDKGRLGRLRWRLQGAKEVPSFAHLNCCESCQVRKHPGASRQGAVKISHVTADFTGLDKASTKLGWLVWSWWQCMGPQNWATLISMFSGISWHGYGSNQIMFDHVEPGTSGYRRCTWASPSSASWSSAMDAAGGTESAFPALHSATRPCFKWFLTGQILQDCLCTCVCPATCFYMPPWKMKQYNLNLNSKEKIVQNGKQREEERTTITDPRMRWHAFSKAMYHRDPNFIIYAVCKTARYTDILSDSRKKSRSTGLSHAGKTPSVSPTCGGFWTWQ